MLAIAPNETILLVMRRHWIVFAGPTTIFFVLLLLPPLALLLGRASIDVLASPMIGVVTNFFLALYFAGLLTYLLLRWLGYYLDVWIITDGRIIDVEQKTIFNREISEMPLDRIQNVTVEIPGFLATMLGFGNIKIQTAGAGEFTISSVSNFNRAKELIVEHSRRQAAVRAATVRLDAGQAPTP